MQSARPVFDRKCAISRGKSPRDAGERVKIVVDVPLGGEEWG